MDDKLFALRKNLELLELRKGVCKLSWQTGQVLGVLERKTKKKGNQDLRESKFEIDMLILDMEMAKVESAIRNRERELEAKREVVVVQEREVSQPVLYESSLENELTMIECTHGTLPSMEVSASPIAYAQEIIEISMQNHDEVLNDHEPTLVQEANIIFNEEIFEKQEVTLVLEEKDETLENLPLVQHYGSPIYKILSLDYEPKEFELVLDKIPQFEMSCDEYISVFNKLMSNRVCGHDFRLKTAPMIFKSTYVFKRKGVLSTMVVIQVKGYVDVLWLEFLAHCEPNHEDLRANPFEEGEIDAEQAAKEKVSHEDKFGAKGFIFDPGPFGTKTQWWKGH